MDYTYRDPKSRHAKLNRVILYDHLDGTVKSDDAGPSEYATRYGHTKSLYQIYEERRRKNAERAERAEGAEKEV